MPSNHLILCYHLLLLPSIFPSTTVFPMTWLFMWGGQRIGDSASASVLLMSFQGWLPLVKTFTIDSESKSSRQDSLWESITGTFICSWFIDISEVTGQCLRNGSICVKSISKEFFFFFGGGGVWILKLVTNTLEIPYNGSELFFSFSQKILTFPTWIQIPAKHPTD